MKRSFMSMLGKNPDLVNGIVNSSDYYILLCDSRRRILYSNPAFCAKTAYTSSGLVAKKITSLFSPHHRSQYISQLTNGLRDGGTWRGETEFRCNNDRTFWARMKFSVISVPELSSPVILCTGHDLTAEKMLLERAWQTENPALEIIDGMNDALAVTDESGKILTCNPALSAMLGYPREEIIGVKLPYPWLNPADQKKYLEAMKSVKRGTAVSNHTISFKRKNSSNVPVSLSMSALNGRKNLPRRIIITARDISNVGYTDALKRSNDRIELLLAELQRKTAILYTIRQIQTFVLHKAPISKIFKEIIAGVQKLVKNDLAGIYLIDRGKRVLSAKILSKQNSFTRRLERFSLPLGEGLVGFAAANGNMMLVNNAHMDPRSIYPNGKRPATEHVIIVPLRIVNRLFGVLAVARNNDPGFIDEDAQLLKSFAEATTVAIENARLAAQAGKGHRENGTTFDDLDVFTGPEEISTTTIRVRK